MSQTPEKVRPAPAEAREVKRGEVVSLPAAEGLVARAARPRRRHRVIVASFLLAVIAPSLASVGYLYLWAADQYASRMAFSVRSGEAAPQIDIFGALAHAAGSGSADAEIVYQFIRSQQMVEAAMAAAPLVEIYNASPEDVVFRLGREQPIEDVTRYWRWMNDVAFDGGAGIVTFTARAFDPDSARLIAQIVLDESTRVVNALSAQAREDAVSVAREALVAAEDRLRLVRRDIRAFRDLEQELDPSENARAALGLTTLLETRLAETQIELETQLALVGPRAAEIPVLRQRIESLRNRIAEERARIGAGRLERDGEARAFSDLVAEYEELVVDREFAERAYLSAMAAYEQAQLEARRQTRYLAPHIHPTLSVEAQYPRRALLAAAVFAALLVAWSVAVLVAYNVFDRR